MTEFTSTRRFAEWRPAFDLIAGGIMLLLAFIGVAAADVSGGGSQLYWSVLVLVFCLICIGLDWVHEAPGTATARPAAITAFHWAGVLLSIQLIHFMVSTGRLTNADTGLLDGTIVALGTFTSGVHVNWRIALIGVVLGLGVAAAAYVEQYLWILFALALLALVVIYFVSRFRRRHAETV